MFTEHDLSSAAGVQAYLLTTPFASTTVTPLSGGNSNFAYRLYLSAPYKGHSTLVLKHARPYVALAASIPLAIERQVRLNCGPFATVPGMHYFDEEAHVIIMDDCGASSLTLKELLLTATPSPAVAREIGLALGEFLGRLHSWAATDPSLLDFFDQNAQAKQITAWVTYGRLISTLTTDNLPAVALLSEPVPPEDIDDIRAIIAERTPEILTSRETLTMGDFWTGNIMVRLRADGEPALERVTVIDWELAKPGVAALDVGQFCAEVHTLQLFTPHAVDAAAALTDAFLTAYRAHCGAMAPHMANVAAKHIGAHLVTITPRVAWGTPEETAKVIKVGLTHLMEGCSDRWIRERSVLALLM
ncbi:kinase-like domain-containing protein [Mycena rosella]|uniref:Kinase-like domain-containing protein n=1 Tax=Mycena rosella TaxID=1033263 RepID=A0AAD7GND3_MYCRO|nr:kinase-like domain-containing protein [Mycena rosella]